MNQSSKNKTVDVALICPTLDGGLGSTIVTLAEKMRNQGLSIEIWVLKKDKKNISLPNVPTREIFSSRATLALIKLVRAINTYKPKNILSASYHVNCVVIFAKMISKLKPHLIIAEHTSLEAGFDSLSFQKRLFAKLAIALLYRFSDELVAVSNDAARQMERFGLLKKNKAQTIYNPVICKDIFEKSKDEINHPFLTSNNKLFLSVGRISKEKDYPTLIAAFEKIIYIEEARLIIVGDGPDKSKLTQLIENSGLSERIALLGHMSNPYPLYSRADVFVLSSIREGLPTVLIEALAFGCKVVSTDARTGPREILKNGAFGTLVPTSDIKALANAMIDSIKDNTKRTIPKDALSNYEVDHAVNRYVSILKLK